MSLRLYLHTDIILWFFWLRLFYFSRVVKSNYFYQLYLEKLVHCILFWIEFSFSFLATLDTLYLILRYPAPIPCTFFSLNPPDLPTILARIFNKMPSADNSCLIVFFPPIARCIRRLFTNRFLCRKFYKLWINLMETNHLLYKPQ